MHLLKQDLALNNQQLCCIAVIHIQIYAEHNQHNDELQWMNEYASL